MEETRVIFGEARESGSECCSAARIRIVERVEERSGIETSSAVERVRRFGGRKRWGRERSEESGTKTFGSPEERIDTVTCRRE
jgi:hypothetical protein